MAKSKNHKNHKQKLNQFKQQTMANQKQNAIPKTNLVPIPEWQSTDMLGVRGDLLETIDQALVAAYQAIGRAGQAYQQIIAMNVQAEKIKIGYTWNNGEPATAEEIENYKQQMARIEQLRAEQIKQAQQEKEAGIENKEQLPGAVLTDAWGSPISSEGEKKEGESLIITE